MPQSVPRLFGDGVGFLSRPDLDLNFDYLANSRPVSAFLFMSQAQIDSVQAGNFALDVTAPLNAAAAFCGSQNPPRALRLPAGGYSVTTFQGIVSYTAGVESNAPSIISGDGQRSTIIRARNVTARMLDMRNTSIRSIRDIWFQGAGLAQTCIDTSWDISVGPALKSFHRNLRITDYTSIGWRALNNNDVGFEYIDFSGCTSATGSAIDLNGPGGNVVFHYVSSLGGGYFDLGVQRADFFGCVSSGFRIKYAGLNVIGVTGGYHYVPEVGSNRTLIEIGAGFTSQGLTLSGWFDTRGSGDTIIGGAGSVLFQCSITGILLGRAGFAGQARMIGASLTNGSGGLRAQFPIALTSTVLIDWTVDRALFHVVTDQCLVQGFRVPDLVLSLANGWVSQGAPYGTLRARLMPGSKVKLFGSIKSGTTTVSTQIASMPTGLFPTEAKIIVANNTNGYSGVQIDTGGNITLANALGGNGYLAINELVELET